MFTDAHLPDILLRAVILPAFAMIWVVFLIRINGLRSLSKMTNFDFVMTIAMGSLLAAAAQAGAWPRFLETILAMGTLFAVQGGLAWARRRSRRVETTIQNQPVLLMRDGKIDEAAMARTAVTEGDLVAKLREANVMHQSEVRAVVLETTGDVSVLHGTDLDDWLLTGVRTS